MTWTSCFINSEFYVRFDSNEGMSVNAHLDNISLAILAEQLYSLACVSELSKYSFSANHARHSFLNEAVSFTTTVEYLQFTAPTQLLHNVLHCFSICRISEYFSCENYHSQVYLSAFSCFFSVMRCSTSEFSQSCYLYDLYSSLKHRLQ